MRYIGVHKKLVSLYEKNMGINISGYWLSRGGGLGLYNQQRHRVKFKISGNVLFLKLCDGHREQVFILI